MGELGPLTKEELVSKLVQEIAKKGDDIPEGYFVKDGFPKAIDAPDLWKNDLLIDFSLLSSFTPSELAKLRAALSEWGCFQVINHGIDFLEEMIEVAKQFFALPLEEKLKYHSEDEIVQGYGSDEGFARSQTPNWNDRLFLLINPKDKIRLHLWPEKPEKFREMIAEYSKKLTIVNEVMCKAMAKSLNIEENCFDYGTQGQNMGLKFTLYPRCAYPDRILGAKSHADGTLLTYVCPEKDVEGLHVMKDDQWYNVLTIPNALFVNNGDLGEVMTNGMFKSVVHRVATNSVKDRMSAIFFFTPDDKEEDFGPRCELVNADQPPVYKKFNMSDYQKKFKECFKLGKRAVEAFKV